jgi:hypothetical protein
VLDTRRDGQHTVTPSQCFVPDLGRIGAHHPLMASVANAVGPGSVRLVDDDGKRCDEQSRYA